jgi:CheY-like chemotaxis protein/HPt (histidine-containing phosphotransfer) domain-containing protein
MKRILIVEDDDISRKFMIEAISLLPVEWLACSGFSEAHQLCRSHRFDLVISDINTADGCLYEHAGQLPDYCRKLAVSAELTPACSARLQALGVHETLAKPMTIAALHQAVARLLEGHDAGMQALPVWDHAQALAALGHNERILTSLKDMFRHELPGMIDQVERAYACGEFDEIQATLHKLKASCGFLGAKRLLDECNRLDADINRRNLEGFTAAGRVTLSLI